MLVLATAFWGVSFPVMKALGMVQQPLVPEAGSWFIASLALVYRFGAAALLLLLVCGRTLRELSRRELEEGVGLGGFAAGGLLLQMDGLAHTAASTSAFLTQFYCVILPLWAALVERRRPAPRVALCVGLALAGVAVLSGIDWRQLRLGRGELETLGASVIFTGQILWLQRPGFAGNNVNRFTLVMFVTIALCCLPVALLTTPAAADWVRPYRGGPALALLAVLVLGCTIGAYGLMNAWQPFVSATQAGLIYCAEPLFASICAFVLPAWISSWSGIRYPNETLGTALLIGGGLVTLANVLMQWTPPKAPAEARRAAG